jgi:anti-sigma factor ChrR (cupin superfamily)
MRKKTKTTSRSARMPRASTGPFAATTPLSEEAALLALAAAPVPAPSPAVKAGLFARIRASKRKAVASSPAIPPGWRFESARSAEGWREPFPGVRFKTLSVDDERDVVMLLVEMAPGARFPDHPHDASADEGVVISGDVDMDGRLMLPGDYYYAGLGTTHVNITSPSGCTALLSLRASAWRQWRTTLTSP